MESPLLQGRPETQPQSCLRFPSPVVHTPGQGSTETSRSLQALGRSLESSTHSGFCGGTRCLSSLSPSGPGPCCFHSTGGYRSLSELEMLGQSAELLPGKRGQENPKCTDIAHFIHSAPCSLRGKPSSPFPSGDPAETSGSGGGLGIWNKNREGKYLAVNFCFPPVT